ncbi:hypothetical protein AOLI_G00320070 [Acnodon oligacanthus]
MPSTLPSFQTQLASIMETLAKTAILEISNLVEVECKILRSEVARSHHEIDSLRKRLQLMEHMLVQEGVQNQQQVGNGNGGEAAVLLTSVQEHRLAELAPRAESQPRVKREGNLDESNRCDSALGERSGEPKKDQTNLEKQSDCVWQHHGEKQPSELLIKQEPDGMDVWNCEIGGQNPREKTACVTGSTSAEEISSTIGHLTGDTAERGIQTVKTSSSADPLDRISLEDNSCDQEGRTLQGAEGEACARIMEAMGSDSRFQTQLSSIMDMLAKTAAAEIGKLVEESHAVLRLEITRRIGENQSLKSRCDFLEKELKATRRRLQASVDAQFGSGFKADLPHRPTIDGVFGKEWCLDLWKDKETSARQKDDSHKDPPVMESVDLIDDGPDMIIIKDETFEDCSGTSKQQRDLKSDEKVLGSAFPDTEQDGGHSSENFIPYNDPLNSTEQRQEGDQTFDPRPSTLLDGAASSNVNLDEFGGYYPSNVQLGIPKTGSEQKKIERPLAKGYVL